MLFKKNISAPDTEPSATDTPSGNEKPICIIGSNALAYLLAAKFTEAGKNTVVMAGSENLSLSTNGITLKEDYQLQKLHIKFNTALWLRETPKLVIITAESSRIKAALTGLTPGKLKDCPVVSFTRLKDRKFIQDILGTPVTEAYFDGWLRCQNQQVTAYGRAPQITLCCPDDSINFAYLQNLLTPLKLQINPASNPDQCFWDFFCLYAPCSLLTAAHNKSVFDLIKNKPLREQLNILVEEISRLVPTRLNIPQPDETVKKIFNIPSGYVFPLQTEIAQRRSGDIDFISSVIQHASITRKQELPAASRLLKQIYEILLTNE